MNQIMTVEHHCQLNAFLLFYLLSLSCIDRTLSVAEMHYLWQSAQSDLWTTLVLNDRSYFHIVQSWLLMIAAWWPKLARGRWKTCSGDTSFTQMGKPEDITQLICMLCERCLPVKDVHIIITSVSFNCKQNCYIYVNECYKREAAFIFFDLSSCVCALCATLSLHHVAFNVI